MTILIKGDIYLCADGEIRRLDNIEDDFLSYSVPIGKIGNSLKWSKLGRTKRYQVESYFINGKVISENEIQ